MDRPVRLAAAAVIGALVVATTASASAAGNHGHHTAAAQHSNKGKHNGGTKGKHNGAAEHTNKGKHNGQLKQHGKPAKFTATGTVTAVDTTAGTVTVADQGGSRDLHGTSVTVVVPDTAKVVRHGPATLSDVQVGDHLAANGVRSDGPTFTAEHVSAEPPDSNGD